jgi:signal transduction histidine kinase
MKIKTELRPTLDQGKPRGERVSIQDDLQIKAPTPAGPGSEKSRYRGLWRFSVIVTSLVAIVPLLIMTVINYLHDKEANRTESQFTVNRILSTTKRSLEFALEERRNALSLILSENSYGELATDAALSSKLRNLQDAFGGFVDPGLIASNGNQTSYAGPYDLKGKNYQGQDWFHEALLRGMYISDVFMGFRNFPHIVIAYRHQKSDGDFYILRATLDMELINSRIYDTELESDTDAFVINEENILQTSSAFYGDVLRKAEIGIQIPSRNTEVIEEHQENGNWFIMGSAHIARTPFTLVVIKRLQDPLRAWVRQDSRILWFLGASIAMILAVVLVSSNRIVSSLREADARRARAFHDLQYTNKLATIGRMAASVAHEINNPLAIINEDAGLLKDMATFSDDFPHKEKTLNLVASIHKSVDRCSNVTHRLLGFAKRMEVRKEPIELETLLEEVVGFQRTEIVHRNINIEYHFPDMAPPIESDRGKLQQVFLNIISNALAAVDDSGHIEIRVTQMDNFNLAVVISDNGKGISEENQRHIFEPFYSTKGEFGTGLGLSITRDIVTKLGGTIDLQSKLGRGTSFIVTLPIKTRELKE